ncbi:MAG: peptidylprolyl isomerase [Oscillospiraceae bacterium]|nr:peptidylprolyl isomerase [Oscillospiraceae bacterium]
MKTSKKALICGILAAISLLAACDNSTSSGDSEISTPGNFVNSPSSTDSTSSGETSIPTNEEVGITSSKPREIKGFEGNVKPVTPKEGDLIATFEIEDYGTIKAVLFPEAAPLGVENFQKLCDAGFYNGLKIHRVMKDFMIQGGSKTGDGASSKDAMVKDGEFGIETAQNARNFYGALCYANSGGMNSTQFYIVNNKKPNDIKTEFDPEVYKNQIEQGKLAIKQAEDDGDTAKAETARQNVQYLQNQLDWVNGMTDEITKKYTEEGGVYYLDGNYTVFGQVFEGFDVLDALSEVMVGDNGRKEVSKPVVPIIIKNVTVTAYDGTEPAGSSGDSTASEPVDER